MENLELMGIQEMDAGEIINYNGGSIVLAFLVAYVVMEIVSNPEAHAKAFEEGWNAAK